MGSNRGFGSRSINVYTVKDSGTRNSLNLYDYFVGLFKLIDKFISNLPTHVITKSNAM